MTPIARFGHLLAFAPIGGFLALARRVPYQRRSRLGRAFGRTAFALVPSFRRRILTNLALIFPNMPEPERRALARRSAASIAATLTEILFNEDQAKHHVPFDLSGPGLDAIRASDAAGKGAVIVSGHFGQWDAVRHALKEAGLETGAIYRPNNNPYYEPHFLRGIEAAGQPIFPRGPDGLKAMLRHLKRGGRVAILADQHFDEGVQLPLLGRPSWTTLSPAQMALRNEVPLVPVWGVRDDARGRVSVIFDAPIDPGTPEEMMTAFNARLGAQILAHPEQWHWAHRRWKRG